jgi:dTMP kinase
MTERGKLYVIEGPDGSGKATQAEMTREHMSKDLGKFVFKTSFPQYGKPSAALVERILNGEFGGDVLPEFAAQAFAIDRLAGTPEIEAHISQGVNYPAVLDRYDASNKAYQGAKYLDREKRHAFYKWVERMEREDLGMLQPDIYAVLLVPPEVSQQNVANKDKRDYTDMTHDIYEADLDLQGRVRVNYLELVELYPHLYTPIECTDMEGKMRTRDAIQLDIRKAFDL